MNFKIIEQADLSQQDFADIVGISRMALSKIVANGNFVRIAKALTMLEKLVADQKLPRGYARTDKERRKALVDKMRERLDSLES